MNQNLINKIQIVFLFSLFECSFIYALNRNKKILLGNNYITMTLKGLGKNKILHSNITPSTVLINEKEIYYKDDFDYYVYTETNTNNTVIVKFNQTIRNAEFNFVYCYSIIYLDLSNFDSSSITNMNNLFIYCRSLSSINFGNFDTSNVLDMSYMFLYCFSLSSITGLIFLREIK